MMSLDLSNIAIFKKLKMLIIVVLLAELLKVKL